MLQARQGGSRLTHVRLEMRTQRGRPHHQQLHHSCQLGMQNRNLMTYS